MQSKHFHVVPGEQCAPAPYTDIQSQESNNAWPLHHFQHQHHHHYNFGSVYFRFLVLLHAGSYVRFALLSADAHWRCLSCSSQGAWIFGRMTQWGLPPILSYHSCMVEAIMKITSCVHSGYDIHATFFFFHTHQLVHTKAQARHPGEVDVGINKSMGRSMKILSLLLWPQSNRDGPLPMMGWICFKSCFWCMGQMLSHWQKSATPFHDPKKSRHPIP